MIRPPKRRARREDAILTVLAEHPGGYLTRFLARDLGYPSAGQLRRDLAHLMHTGRVEATEVRNWNAAVASQWSWHLAEAGERR